jgi:SAM-dependent methyltransferase
MTSKQAENVTRFYPEVRAGGFSHVDGTVEFYTRVNALLEPNFIVLDLGAGRGEQLYRDPSSYRTKLTLIKGKVAKLVGADLDEVVLENPFLDEAKVIRAGEPYPFSDNTFDLILADCVIEHIDDPIEFASEITRVLKPGGWFCARTPNRWGMIGVFTGLVPNRAHAGLLAKLQHDRQARDVFPTRYRLNSLARLRCAFPKGHWEHYSYISNPEPPYIQRSVLAMRAVLLAWRLLPQHFHTVMNVFMRLKK